MSPDEPAATGVTRTSLVLRLEGISKAYPGVLALRDVSLDVTAGEVVGLVGENGAGKSTLLKVLSGGTEPTSGTIQVDGRLYRSLTPALAASLGVAVVHQELQPFTNLDVAANMLLGREIVRGPLRRLDEAAMAARVQPVLDLVGATFGPRDPVAGLSLGQQQLLEVARALSREARLIVMDEPTSSLSLSESQALLSVVAGLKAQGVAVLFVSHRLSEVAECADRVVVLRDGRNAGTLAQGEIAHEAMIRLMVGRNLAARRQREAVSPGRPVLEFIGVATAAFPRARADLTVRAGEIVALAGLVGAGRTELARAAYGIDFPLHGSVRVDGTPLPPRLPACAIAAGLCLVPEDRKDQGLVIDFPVAWNVSLPSLRALSRRGRIEGAAEGRLAARARDDLSIKVADLDAPVALLSGGNQQKVVLARWLAMRPRALILDEPTRGVDVGAKAEIYRIMRDLADRGVGILMISSDMEEVIGVADRVAVMRGGAVAGTLDGDNATEEAILRLAVGAQGSE